MSLRHEPDLFVLNIYTFLSGPDWTQTTIILHKLLIHHMTLKGIWMVSSIKVIYMVDTVSEM